MTTRIDFYHLTRSPLDVVLPKLLERALGTGARVVVKAGSPERVAYLDDLLWTFEPESWLPHGSARDGNADLQPVFLTDKDENPNQASILVLTDGAVPDRPADYARCLNLFDGNDGQAVDTARALWKEWKDSGFLLIYQQQNESGGWQEKARTGGDAPTA